MIPCVALIVRFISCMAFIEAIWGSPMLDIEWDAMSPISIALPVMPCPGEADWQALGRLSVPSGGALASCAIAAPALTANAVASSILNISRLRNRIRSGRAHRARFWKD